MTQVTIDQAIQIALQHHRAGRLAEADGIYGQILAQQPGHAQALYLRGTLASQVNRNDIAISLLRQALVVKPEFPEACLSLGNAFQASGQLDEAIRYFRRAVELKPDFADAHCNLGNALQTSGQSEEAVAASQRAISLKSALPEAHNNLGNALQTLGRLGEAIASYQMAVTLSPKFVAAHFNLGNALRANRQLEAACIAYRNALSLAPGFAEAHFNLGGTLQLQGRIGEAMACFQRAADLKPDFFEAHEALANLHRQVGRLDDAIASFRQAIRLRPDSADMLANLANALKDAGQIDQAIMCYRQALALEPKNAKLHSNLLLILNFHRESSRQSLYAEARRWAEAHAEPQSASIDSHPNDRSPDRRLRIGYISRDFREHPVGLNLLRLFAAHSHEHFEIFCYNDQPIPSEVTDRFKTYADHCREIVGVSDEQLTEMVRHDRIDILVDLAVHTDLNRLGVFARKPAPVQVSFAGYPGTTGLRTIDYRLTDPYLDPPDQADSIDPYYSEKSIRLPDTFWCYDPLGDGPVVSPLPAQSNGYVTFGCLNNFSKVNEPALELWARVLREVDGSRMMLLAAEGSHRQRVLDVFQRMNVAASRVEFLVPRPRVKYMELYHRIDIGLDTFPYNGHTTSLDSYWMGVPVVTLVGSTALGRAGLSQLMNLGMPELIARSTDEYVKIATTLAGDQPRLATLRATLRQRMLDSPLMDGAKYARNVEAAYRQMWRRHCECYGIGGVAENLSDQSLPASAPTISPTRNGG
jgi:predicted O-linked N-acetylglucosamine transferase (SPINDLY family)